MQLPCACTTTPNPNRSFKRLPVPPFTTGQVRKGERGTAIWARIVGSGARPSKKLGKRSPAVEVMCTLRFASVLECLTTIPAAVAHKITTPRRTNTRFFMVTYPHYMSGPYRGQAKSGSLLAGAYHLMWFPIRPLLLVARRSIADGPQHETTSD